MDEIKLYHVSYNLCEPLTKEFIPRIPSNALTEENHKYERICLSDSIEGCINAMEEPLVFSTDIDSITIVVWEKDFSLSDPFLKDWRYLYENNLVADAALTHEYWYLNNLFMTGSYYEIIELRKAFDQKRDFFLIKPKYRDEVLSVFLKHGADESELKTLDLCSLVNEWLPLNLQEKMSLIIEEIKQNLTTIDEMNYDNFSEYNLIFHEAPKPSYVLDMESRKLFYGLKFRKSDKK